MAAAPQSLEHFLDELRRQAAKIKEGGGKSAIDRQHAKNRLTARERISALLDPQTD